MELHRLFLHCFVHKTVLFCFINHVPLTTSAKGGKRDNVEWSLLLELQQTFDLINQPLKFLPHTNHLKMATMPACHVMLGAMLLLLRIGMLGSQLSFVLVRFCTTEPWFNLAFVPSGMA